eukprot:8884330-Pyramimonas_sp.AAC.1
MADLDTRTEVSIQSKGKLRSCQCGKPDRWGDNFATKSSEVRTSSKARKREDGLTVRENGFADSELYEV